MPFKEAVFLLILGVLTCSLSAQVDKSNIVIIQDPSIDTILEKHVEINEALLSNEDNYAIDGYRIQIFEESGVRSSTMAREAMDEFSEKYPDIPIYLTWQAPNYKVRIGDFGTRMEAEGFLKKIKKDYPIAWVIRDKIKFPLNN
jgi:hypothetical protein